MLQVSIWLGDACSGPRNASNLCMTCQLSVECDDSNATPYSQGACISQCTRMKLVN